MDIIENRYRMIIESERSGRTISDVCIAFGVSRQTWYKWKRRYNVYGLDGLKNQSKRPHNIENVKITKELEKIILELLADIVNERRGAILARAGDREISNLRGRNATPDRASNLIAGIQLGRIAVDRSFRPPRRRRTGRS